VVFHDLLSVQAVFHDLRSVQAVHLYFGIFALCAWTGVYQANQAPVPLAVLDLFVYLAMNTIKIDAYTVTIAK